MIDPVTASNDRLRDTGRWGYTGDVIGDPLPGEMDDAAGSSRWLLWTAILAVVIIALIALFGGVI